MQRYAVILAIAVVAIVAMLRPPAKQAVVTASAVPSPSPHLRGRRAASPLLLIYVAGAVNRPGLYRVHAGSRADDAVRLAGGLRADADAAGVNLAAPLQDGEEIAVPVPGARSAHKGAPHRSTRPRARRSSTPKLAAGTQIDLNPADVTTLERVPGIGSAMAQRLVIYREANGPFASLDELADVAGMTSRRIDSATPYLVLGH